MASSPAAPGRHRHSRSRPAVIAAVAELLRLVLIAGAVIAAWPSPAGSPPWCTGRARDGASCPSWCARFTPVTPPAPRAVQEPRPAVGAPHEVHIHIHGASAEDVAAILTDVNSYDD